MPYTLGYRMGGAQEAMYTFLAPHSRTMLIISVAVVPRTMLSSTSRTHLPANSIFIGLSLRRTLSRRSAWPGMMNVRPMYRFLMKPSR